MRFALSIRQAFTAWQARHLTRKAQGLIDLAKARATYAEARAAHVEARAREDDRDTGRTRKPLQSALHNLMAAEIGKR